MFKTLNQLEQKIRKVLIDFKSTGEYPDISDKDTAYAFYLCCQKNYITNVFTAQNANRDYLFQKSGNDHITEDGLNFIRNTSLVRRITSAIFSLLKGTLGFIIGVAATVISTYIIWLNGWI